VQQQKLLSARQSLKLSVREKRSLPAKERLSFWKQKDTAKSKLNLIDNASLNARPSELRSNKKRLKESKESLNWRLRDRDWQSLLCKKN
jgi:hypothetical protein